MPEFGNPVLRCLKEPPNGSVIVGLDHTLWCWIKGEIDVDHWGSVGLPSQATRTMKPKNPAAVRPKCNRLLLPLRTMFRIACFTKLGGGVAGAGVAVAGLLMAALLP